MPLFLGITGTFLHSGLKQSLLIAEEEKLRGHLYLLFSVAELDSERQPPTLTMPASLIEAEFERINSGLYGYIFNQSGELVWRSTSAALQALPKITLFSPITEPGKLIFKQHEYKRLFSAHYDVIWDNGLGQEFPYRFVVAHSADSFNAERRAYRTQLLWWLGTAGIFLLFAQTAILHWGLKPLKRLSNALAAMQSGATGRIEGEHPKELQTLVLNLNQVLAREEALRTRYRNSLSDLAHSLKTPLAVVQSKLNDSEDNSTLKATAEEQIARMNDVITYQLQRAVSSQRQGSHLSTPLAPIVIRLINTLSKVYRDKHTDCAIDIDPNLVIACEEQDLMEVLGNLLDNAFKYGNRWVEVVASQKEHQIEIKIIDDGAGISPENRSKIIERGKRLDTQQPGQGIGLAVAREIIESYQGTLQVEANHPAGSVFILTLPAPINVD